MDKVKATFELDPQVKLKLAMMKAELRAKGVPATEAAIVEALIDSANPSAVSRLVKGRL